MKKIFVFGLMALTSLSIFAQDVEVVADTTEANQPEGYYPYTVEGKWENTNPSHTYTGLSIFVPFGATFADMDEKYGSVMGAKLLNGDGKSYSTPNLGIGVAYDFTPQWGLQGQFMVSNYGLNSFYAHRLGKDANGNQLYNSLGGTLVDKRVLNQLEFDDDTHRAKPLENGKPDFASLGIIYNMDIQLTFDLADAFFPLRTNTLFSCYAMFGAGIGFYQYQGAADKKFSSYRACDKAANSDKELDPYKLMKYNFDPYLTCGLLLDFNVTRSFGLGARVAYNYYMSDQLDFSNETGYSDLVNKVNKGARSDNNDGLFLLDIVARYKICANDKSHVRNLTQNDFLGLKNEEKIREIAEQAAKDEIAKTPRLKDTLVIEQTNKDTVVFLPEQMLEDMYVYFPNDKYTLDEAALIRIHEAALILQKHPNTCLELTGFADNTGSRKHNEDLARNRANAVKKQLIEMYGISEDRLVDLGCGTLTNTKASYGPNRRVAMRIVSREEVKSIRDEKAENEKNAIIRATGDLQTDLREKAENEGLKLQDLGERVFEDAKRISKQTVDDVKEALSGAKKEAAVEEAAAEEKVAEEVAAVEEKVAEKKAEMEESDDDSEELSLTFDRTQYLAIVKTGKATTLQKLAAKYYGDPEKWNLIYDANKETISNPSYIWPGTSLLIPVLH